MEGRFSRMAPKFFVFGFGKGMGEIGEEIHEFLRKGISGVVLFQRNCPDRVSLWLTLKHLIEFSKRKLIIAVDQEGGDASHLKNGFTIGIPPMGLRATGDENYAFRMGERISNELSTVGVNTIFAPSLDVTIHGNPIIGLRSFSNVPNEVVKYSAKFIEGLKSNGIKVCVKHFPGHGPTRIDSHEDLPRINLKKWDYLENHVSVFKKVFERTKYEMIMTAHVLHPELDEKPGTLSKFFLTDLLRGEYGFDGVIITDCLEMKAMSAVYGIERAVVEAFKAGADLLLLSHTPEYQFKAVKALRDAIEDGEIPKEMVRRSLERVENFLNGLPEFPEDFDAVLGMEKDVEFEMELSRRAIFRVSRNGDSFQPLNENQNLVLLPLNLDERLIEYLRKRISELVGEFTIISPSPEDIARMDKEILSADVVLITTSFRSDNDVRKYRDVVHRMVEMKPNVVHVSLKNPYDVVEYDFVPHSFATFGSTRHQLDVLLEALAGEFEPTGSLPMRGAES